MGKAVFSHGSPVIHNWDATSDQTAGDVIQPGAGQPTAIVHVDVTSGEKAVGVALKNGIYECEAGEALTAFTKVQWSVGLGQVQVTGDAAFGIVLTAAAAQGDKVLVLHDPNA